MSSIPIADAGFPVFYSEFLDRSLKRKGDGSTYIMSIFRVISFQTLRCYSKTPSKSSPSRSSTHRARSPSNRTCVTLSKEAI